MLRRLLPGLLLLSPILLVGVLAAQPPAARPGSEPPAGKLRGSLRPNWGKVGLSDDQKQQIYKVQADYRSRIQALEEQLQQLRKQQEGEEFKVLTAAQRARLKEILGGRVPELPQNTAKKDTDKPTPPEKP